MTSAAGCKEYDREPELLAPAGNWDCVRAAVANGADAVFFGLSQFNARLRADNFTEEDLPELMEFLHARGVKGLVTMNTLIFTSELKAAEAQLRLLERCGVDAIIVQDLGLARLARTVAPGLEIHGSTQMTITSPEGMAFADRLFELDRAVLARELAVEEIRKFDPQHCVPLEVFVHGALCVAYSGQCLTSESLGRRSANRGECAQACRMPYELVVDGEAKPMDEVRYLLSPQDLAAIDVVGDLVRMGVVSFKIEGRLKSPEYVAAVTRAYRKAIDDALLERANTVTERDRYALEMTFSRGLSTGWLRGTNHPYLTHGKFGKKRGAYVGEITKVLRDAVVLQWAQSSQHRRLKAGDGLVFDAGEDRNEEQGARVHKVEGNVVHFHKKYARINWQRVAVGQGVWKTDDPELNAEVKGLWKNAKLEVKAREITVKVSGKVGEPLALSCEGVSVESEIMLERAEKRPLRHELLVKQLGRLGGTMYRLGSVEMAVEGEVLLPISEINRLRRSFVAALDALAANEKAKETARVEVSADSLYPKVDSAGESLGASVNAPKSIELSVLARTTQQVQAALKCGVGRIYADFEDIRRYKDAVTAVRESGRDTKIYIATPRIQKPNETGYFKYIDRAEADGVLIRNLGAIDYFMDREDLRRVGDFSLNCANPLTAKILKEEGQLDHLTVSYDLNIEQVVDLLRSTPSEWFELTLHQHMPMFHMEHCVFCTFLSDGTSYKDCGRPCESHVVQLRDRVGQLHTLQADVGCRNTLFNGKAQTGARYFETLRDAGLQRVRIDLLDETPEQARRTIQAYQQLVRGQTGGELLWQDLDVMEKLGVTEGTFS